MNEIVPVRGKSKTLQHFAEQVEEMFCKGKDQGPIALKRQVCRLMASADPKVAAMMTAKWVEWMFGKPKETIEHKGHIEHTVFDASRLTDEQLAEAERLVESASIGRDQG